MDDNRTFVLKETANLMFDLEALKASDFGTRWNLYRLRNNVFDGEIVLAFLLPTGKMAFTIGDDKFPENGSLLGELEWKVVGDTFVDEIVPLRERSADEMEQRRQQTEAHKAYRAECWRRYSMEQRVKDLGSDEGY
jgi:hypothetical protein